MRTAAFAAGREVLDWVGACPCSMARRLEDPAEGDHKKPAPTGLVEGMSADEIMPSDAQVRAAAEGRATHPGEPHAGGTAGRLTWLRAGVLGANDGIVSVAGIVIGVAGATADRGAQVEVARKLVGQGVVSWLGHRDDMLLSTLYDY
jgi:hypothetical protein